MAPLFKVTLEGTFSETFYVRAECEDWLAPCYYNEVDEDYEVVA